MPIYRFFIPTDLEGVIPIEGDELRHLQVLRLEVNETIEIVNGRGDLAKVCIESIEKKRAFLKVVQKSAASLPTKKLILAVPYLMPSKLELIIEKCTEIGAWQFLLYFADHSEKKEISEHALKRLKALSISAMKQCGRLFLPSIEKVSFQEVLKRREPLYFGSLDKEENSEGFQKEAIFISGPEKGFSDKEKKALRASGVGVSLNSNILRAETAPIVASAIFQSS